MQPEAGKENWHQAEGKYRLHTNHKIKGSRVKMEHLGPLGQFPRVVTDVKQLLVGQLMECLFARIQTKHGFTYCS